MTSHARSRRPDPACSTPCPCCPRSPTSWSSAPPRHPRTPGPTASTGRPRAAGPAPVPERCTAASRGGVRRPRPRPPRRVGRAATRWPATGVGPRLEDDAARPVRELRGQRPDRRPAGPRAAAAGDPDGGARATGATCRSTGRARRRLPRRHRRVVVFLHGLCENESYWNRGRDDRGTTYGETLAAEGWTPVFLRANTGLGLRENGVALVRAAAAAGRGLAGAGRPGSRWSGTRWAG